MSCFFFYQEPLCSMKRLNIDYFHFSRWASLVYFNVLRYLNTPPPPKKMNRTVTLNSFYWNVHIISKQRTLVYLNTYLNEWESWKYTYTNCVLFIVNFCNFIYFNYCKTEAIRISGSVSQKKLHSIKSWQRTKDNIHTMHLVHNAKIWSKNFTNQLIKISWDVHRYNYTLNLHHQQRVDPVNMINYLTVPESEHKQWNKTPSIL